MAAKKKNTDTEATVKAGETVHSAADAKALGAQLGIQPADSDAFVSAVEQFASTEAPRTITVGPSNLDEAVRALFPFLGIEDEKTVNDITITAAGRVRIFRTDRSVDARARFTPFEREERKWVR